MMSSATPEQHLEELGLVLPPPAAAVANYVPWAITGNLIMTQATCPGATASWTIPEKSAASFRARMATSAANSPASMPSPNCAMQRATFPK